MNSILAVQTLERLANGIDPVTRDPLPAASPYHLPVVVRALFHALTAMRRVGSAPDRDAAVQLDVAPALPLVAEPMEEPAFIPSAPKDKQRKAPRPPPVNAGKPWTPEEDTRLCDEFSTGIDIKALATRHSRSTAALKARLFKLGKIADPGIPLRSRPVA